MPGLLFTICNVSFSTNTCPFGIARRENLERGCNEYVPRKGKPFRGIQEERSSSKVLGDEVPVDEVLEGVCVPGSGVLVISASNASMVNSSSLRPVQTPSARMYRFCEE